MPPSNGMRYDQVEVVISPAKQEITVAAVAPTSTENDQERRVQLLSQEDLRGFIARREAVNRAQLDLNMIVGGYESWASDLRERYSIEGLFEVNPQTGEIKVLPEPEPDDG